MNSRTVLEFSDELLKYDFGHNHPLRPERIKVTVALMKSYGLLSLLDLQQPRLATMDELKLFHKAEYLDKVQNYSKYGSGLLDAGDTPAFKGCFEVSSLIAGSSLRACESIMSDDADHGLNLSGGLHHAYPERASGFCIFNDPALCISFLKKNYQIKRLAYIDIDAHHGDGVMYGFYSDPSVLNIDLHEDGHYLFPGTGFPEETGEGEASGLKINVPLPPLLTDDLYLEAFEGTVTPAIKHYRPEVILLQSGADSHKGDLLAHLALTAKTYREVASRIHSLAHEFCKGKVVIFGGGGYKLSNVARCWTTVLSVFVEKELPNSLPDDWREYYRSVVNEDPPKLLIEEGSKGSDDARQKVIAILDELERTTIIGN